MRDANDLISALIKTANRRQGRRAEDVRGLLLDAVASIRAMRDEIARWPSPNVKDAVLGLEEVAQTVEEGSAGGAEIDAALIDAADMLRDLHIVLDSGTEIDVKEPIPLEPPTNTYPA
ncbi:hypothetical protein ACLE20_14285 [Rhizobium sp. YIM 134829]|uniref:hypothetical protein n=1 Tax=Rhizobium sp. YIM 134829 TaxID=3390453 RepID=UPI003979B0C2